MSTTQSSVKAATELVRFTHWAKEQARVDLNFLKLALQATEARIDTLEADLAFTNRKITEIENKRG